MIDGTAQLTISTLTGGVHQLKLDYSGDGTNFAASKNSIVLGSMTSTYEIGSYYSVPSGVAVDSYGNIFFSSYYSNKIWMIHNGTTSLFAWTPFADLWCPTGLAVDSAGSVYVADYGQDRVCRITTTYDPYDNHPIADTFSTVTGTSGVRGYSDGGGDPWNFAPDALLNMPASVAVDTAGKLYIADTGNHLIRKIDFSIWPQFGGQILDIAGTPEQSGYAGDGGLATDALLNTPVGIAVDAAGNIFIADYYDCRVRKVDAATGIITTIAGDGTDVYGGDGGLATAAQVDQPKGIAVDVGGNVYISDRTAGIRKIDAATGLISTVVTGLSLNVSQITFDSSGNLYIADNDNSVIQVVVPSSPLTINPVDTTVTVTALPTPATFGESVTLTANIVTVTPVAPESSSARLVGNVEFVDMTTSTSLGTAAISYGGYGQNINDGSASFNISNLALGTHTITANYLGNINYGATGSTPQSTAIPTTLQVSYSTNTAVSASATTLDLGQSVTFTATVTTNPSGAATPTGGTVTFLDSRGGSLGTAPLVAGTAALTVTSLGGGTHYVTASYSGDDDTFLGNDNISASTTVTTVGGPDYPSSLVVNAAGRLFVTKYNVIYEVNPSTGAYTLFASPFNSPHALAADAAGHLFIADTGNRRVRQVDLDTGVTTTIAGDGTYGFGGDGGTATSAQLTPYGIAVDDAGNLFIADDLNQRIRRVDLATGVITTYAGTGTAGYSGDGGPATDAMLNLNYSSLAVDDAGNLFISDTNNHRIRRVDHSTGVITTVASNTYYGGITANTEYFFIANYDNGIRAVNLATGMNATMVGTYSFNDVAIDSAGGLFALEYRQAVRVTYGLEISVTDTTQPTATINRAASQPSPTQVGPLHFTAVFSKPVVDFSSAGVALGGTSDADKVVVYDVGDHQTFDILVSGMTHGGTVTVDIAAGVAHDATGNANLAATNTDNSVTFTVPDYTPPVASANPSGVATGASSATFTVAYTDPDDPVLYSSIDGNDIQVTGAAGFSQLATLAGTTPSTNASSITATYRIDSPDGPWTQANAGTYTITMQSSQVSDTNNNFVAPGDLGTFQIADITPPTVTISQTSGQADPTNASPINFTVVFSEPVSDFAMGDVTFSGSTTGGTLVGAVTNPSSDQKVYNVAVSGMADSGAVVATIAAGAAHDAANNSNTVATFDDNTVQYNMPGPPAFDLTGPTSGTYTVGQNVTIAWTAANVGSGSTISLCYDTDATFNGNETWIEIDQVAAADGAGAYTWDTTGMASGTYYVGGYLWSGGAATFSHLGQSIAIQADIVATPTFSLTGPTSGTYSAGQDVTIAWTAANVGSGGTISLCYDTDATFTGNETWIEIDQVAAADGTGAYTWDTTGMASGTYYVGGYLWSGGTATFSHLGQSIAIQADIVATPTFDLTGPTSGTYSAGQNVTIAWTAANVGSGSTISLCYDTDTTFNGNETWIEIDQVAAVDGAGAYTWDTTGTASGTYYVGGYLWSGGAATFSHLGQPIAIAAPLTLAASSAEKIGRELSDDVVLDSRDELTPIVEEAIRRLASANNSSILAYASIEIVDLPNLLLGETVGNTIRIDRDAAGYGWFVDPTPADDLEFADVIGQHVLAADNSSPAAHRVDLLTTVMHEMGHVLGYKHSDSFDLMHSALPLGTRWSLSGESAFSTGKRDSDIAWDNRLVNTSVLDQVFASFDDHGDRFA